MNPESQEVQENPLIREDWIPTPARNFLQVELIRSMCGDSPTNEQCEIWSQKYSEMVHKIIDNTENVRLRSLILQSRYEEASREVRMMLETGETMENQLVA